MPIIPVWKGSRLGALQLLPTALWLLAGSCSPPQLQAIAPAPPQVHSASPSPAGPAQPRETPWSAVNYSEVFAVTYFSCKPCHNRHTLPQVISRLQALPQEEIAGEDRQRLLAELKGLKNLIDSGAALGFSSGQEELHQSFSALPGAFYLRLERGAMPPPWAPALMEAIEWPDYQVLNPEQRVLLLRYSKPFSQRYLPQSYPQPSPLATPQCTEEERLLAEAQTHFQPLQARARGNSPRVLLGQQLFHEPRLSLDGTISCKSCHDLQHFGVDRRPVSVGHGGQRGTRNAPTVLNAFLNTSQFWDGRARDLADQAGHPILNPVEMAMPDQAAVLARLKQIPGYVEAFAVAFPEAGEALSFAHLTEALAAFQETLATPSRFDQYLQGQRERLNASEKRGLALFMQRGCVACHKGQGLGGDSLQKLGISGEYSNLSDLGRQSVTGRKRDFLRFKVPILRNVAETAPYFHDGAVPDLKSALRIMGQIQLGQNFSEQELTDLEAFLKSLTGAVPAEALTPVTLPR